MKRYIMAVLLLTACIGGAQARDFYVGTNNPGTATYRYVTLENMVENTNWSNNTETTNNIYITSNLTVAKKIRLDHSCSIKPYGGNRTITAATSADFGGSAYSISNSAVFEIGSNSKSVTVSLDSNTGGNGSTYTITIKGLGGDYGTPVPPEDWMTTNDIRVARCVTVVNSTFNFNAGTLTKGYSFEGGGVYVNWNSTVTMSGTAKITGCSAEQGGGVFNRGKFNLEGNATITGNAVWADNRAKIEYNKNNPGSFKPLSLALGGGICTKMEEDSDKPVTNIKGGTISYNTIEDRVGCRIDEYPEGVEGSLVPTGAGVAVYGGKTVMSGGSIDHNTNKLDIAGTPTADHDADWHYHISGGGGVSVTSYKNMTLAANNDAFNAETMTGYFTMTGGTITDNESRRGGAFHLEGASETVLTGTASQYLSIKNNDAFQQGGGVFIGNVEAKFEASYTDFNSNTSSAGGGGAIYIFASDPNTKVSNSSFTKNAAEWSGGAILLKCTDGWADDNAYLHLNNVAFSNNKSNQTLKNGHTVNNNGHAISNSGKLYLSGNITLNSSEGVPQDCCLATDLNQWDNYSRVRDHVLFKEGTISFMDQGGNSTALDIHVLAPTDRQNIFVSTSKSTVTDADMALFNIKNKGWEDTKYFNSREMAMNPKLGDIDKDYAQDKMYSGWNETADLKGRIATQQPTYVIELHKLGQITITNDKLREGESAIYVVKPKDGAAGNDLRQEYLVVLTGTSTDVVNDPETIKRTITEVEPGDYYVTEQTWNWAYENSAKTSDTQWVSAGETKTYSFTGTRQSPAQKGVMYDEDIEENFTGTRVSIDSGENVNL